MEKALKYKLNIQLFGEDDPAPATDENPATDPVIDLDKLKPKDETEVSELEQLKLDNARLLKEKADADKKAEKAKNAADKAMSDRAALSKEKRELEAKVTEPEEKIAEYEAELAQFRLDAKKNEAFLGFTEINGITKDHSKLLVGSLYHEDTNEVSVPDLVENLGVVFQDVIKQAYEQGYSTRDTELASGKPRSIGSNKSETIAERKKREYQQRKKR